MIRIHEFNYHGLKGKENNQHNEILEAHAMTLLGK